MKGTVLFIGIVIGMLLATAIPALHGGIEKGGPPEKLAEKVAEKEYEESNADAVLAVDCQTLNDTQLRKHINDLQELMKIERNKTKAKSKKPKKDS